eukprot:3523682-Rhodomonas_salina.2
MLRTKTGKRAGESEPTVRKGTREGFTCVGRLEQTCAVYSSTCRVLSWTLGVAWMTSWSDLPAEPACVSTGAHMLDSVQENAEMLPAGDDLGDEEEVGLAEAEHAQHACQHRARASATRTREAKKQNKKSQFWVVWRTLRNSTHIRNHVPGPHRSGNALFLSIWAGTVHTWVEEGAEEVGFALELVDLVAVASHRVLKALDRAREVPVRAVDLGKAARAQQRIQRQV